MIVEPRIYVTNFASPGKHGPGPLLTIMAQPRIWERGEGVVLLLVPTPADMRAARNGTLTLADYRARYDARLASVAVDLAPGVLRYLPGQANPRARGVVPDPIVVPDGATLCCACPCDQAAKGKCHRAFAATHLARAGWRVVIDGRDMGAPGLF